MVELVAAIPNPVVKEATLSPLAPNPIVDQNVLSAPIVPQIARVSTKDASTLALNPAAPTQTVGLTTTARSVVVPRASRAMVSETVDRSLLLVIF